MVFQQFFKKVLAAFFLFNKKCDKNAP